MHIIPYMTGEAAQQSDRVVAVSAKAFRLFQYVGLTPPPGEGQQFDPVELDAMLAARDLDIETRMEVKAHLVAAGLLSLGRVVDARR